MNTVKPATLRLAEAAHYAVGIDLPASEDLVLVNPQRLQHLLETNLAGTAARVCVAGTLDRRLVCIERPGSRWVLADLSGQPHQDRNWPSWACGHIDVQDPGSWLSLATLDEQAVYRLCRPKLLLAALYHLEYFPLPRFPLGISDVARAARSTLTGTVMLADMQLGTTLDELMLGIRADTPDILGISVTFGQHDLMTQLLDAVFRMPRSPLVIAGGSLTARNERLLLERYPSLLVARGGGEATIEGLLAH
jgi:hypothetical protein